MDELTPQQQVFVSEYLIDRNGKKAAIRAGYSEETAASQASRLLTNVNVQNFINLGVSKIEVRNELKTDDIIRELLKIATFDIGDMFAPDGSVLPISEMPESMRRCIVQFEIEDIVAGQAEDRRVIGTTKKIKLADKTKALELLGKHLKMFVNRIEIDTGENLAERMKAARERALSHERSVEDSETTV